MKRPGRSAAATLRCALHRFWKPAGRASGGVGDGQDLYLVVWGAIAGLLSIVLEYIKHRLD
jgi:hypothetical protein